jgi:chromosome segregation ATPase
MDADFGSDDWSDEFTREEMLEQHAHRLEEECRMLNEELSRYRKNMAKLIDMHGTASGDCEKLRIALAAAKADISRLHNDTYERGRTIGALKAILSQRDSVMRQFGVPEDYFGSPRTDL